MIKVARVDKNTVQLTFEQLLKCKHIGGIANSYESSDDKRYMILIPYHSISDHHYKHSDGKVHGADSDGQYIELKSLETIWKDSDMELFVFNDAKELYRWMGEENDE